MALEWAVLTNTVTGERIEVLFNPNEYSLNKDINFAQAAVPGLSTPLLQFVHGNLRTLELELLFDSFEQHKHSSRTVNRAHSDVRKLTQKIVDLMAIERETHAPPVVVFSWGGLSFTGVVSRVNQRFTMFLDSGVPVRARLQVTFQEWKTAVQEAKEVRRQTSDYTRIHRLAQGETLAQVAATFYRDPTLWRPIAIANGIDDPRRIDTARELTVPKLPYRDPDSGLLFVAGAA
jgi:Contractile injection system tube protein